MKVNKENIDYWHGEIGASIDAAYINYGTDDEYEEEFSAFQDIINLARKALEKIEGK